MGKKRSHLSTSGDTFDQNLNSELSSRYEDKPEETGQAPKQDDEAFNLAVLRYENNDDDWSGLSETERYLAVAEYFWEAAIAHARKSDDRLKELYQAFKELLDEAMAERRQKFGDFRGGPEKYYADDIELRDQIAAFLNEQEKNK